MLSHIFLNKKTDALITVQMAWKKELDLIQ